MKIFVEQADVCPHSLTVQEKSTEHKPPVCLGEVHPNTPLRHATLAQRVWTSGLVPPAALCSGLGCCRACRVRFTHTPPVPVEAEVHALGDAAVAEGWRLACKHPAFPLAGGDYSDVTLPAHTGSHTIVRHAGLQQVEQRTAVRLAVDLGTTSIHWRAMDAAGSLVAEGRLLNPQMGVGSDVVSRVAFACRDDASRKHLAMLVLEALQGIVKELGVPVKDIVVAGNTAMTAILLNKDCTGLARAPYSLPERGQRSVELCGLPPVWIPPQPAPFVGGDVSAGMAALLHTAPQFPFLLADMGTNGEMVLALDAATALVTSVPLGPALEGIGLRHGVMAEPGCVTGFALSPTGLSAVVEPGSTTTRGICGTGYLSLIDVLRRVGLLNMHGQIIQNVRSPLAVRLARTIKHAPHTAWTLDLPHGLALYADDVEALLSVRAAFALGMTTLLDTANMKSTAMAAVYLTGALGSHAPLEALERLGFLPSGLGQRLHCLSNAALDGATLLALHPEQREPLALWSAQCRVVDLTAQAHFTTVYATNMVFTEWA